MVRDSGDNPDYGDAGPHVSRETRAGEAARNGEGIEGWGVRPPARPVPQPRAENPADTTRGATVEFRGSGRVDRATTGTVYGRGGKPVVPKADSQSAADEAKAETRADMRSERRSTPSPRPHPSVVTADTEGAMTDAYVSRETEDPPLAQEAKRAVEILNPSGEITMPRPPRRRTMCVANQKGGVGKTTTAVNIAVALALHGNRVLVIDLDPQGNASTGLNVPHHSGVPDVYDCLIDGAPLDAVTQQVEGIPNLWAVPATIDLAGAEIELVSVVARESRLKRAIEAGGSDYDYIFIDCPPSLGLLTVNALVAAEEVLIPIQCEYYALEGVQALTNNIELVRSHLNPKLDISTVLLTMYDRRTRLADLVEQDVRNHFGPKCLNAVIPRNVRVSEAPSYSQSVMTYDPGSRGAVSYFEAAQEIALRGAQDAQVGGVA
ncbi:ParA family protein [Dactylosporangium sp. NBC_01737]|uniref:ParA family protein n=1 Tax=Dactylosporangium sp. NBC_01737 TaxID=2975959 RepID=UPI003FA39F97